MMKRTCKHILAAALVIVMLFTVAIPVFAADADTAVEHAYTTRSGYRTGSFMLGGVSHDFTATIAGSTTDGAYTSVTVLDDTQVGRRHENLSVVFVTTDSGNQPGVGGYKNITCKGTSQSYYVEYTRGMEYVKSYYSLRGNIIIFGDTNYTITLGV